MNQQIERQMLVDLYHDYVLLAGERELSITELDASQLEALSVADLRRIVGELRALVRTPR